MKNETCPIFKQYLSLLAFLLISTLSFSQASFGGYSNKVKWQQIKTEEVTVIFPEGLEGKAQRVANIIIYMNENNVGLLGKKRKKVSIVLRNNDVISNGYAQIAPLKSEFFLQAPQNTFEESAVDWTDQLAIHEYRHINQFVNARRGIGHLIYGLFGDYGWGGIIGVTMPAWFIEGDATITETALSRGGRGRVPSFSAVLRAQQQEDVKYSYMKALNGSYKDFVPNHYNTGYLIISEMRQQSKNADFDEITRRSSRFNGIIYPFRRAVRKVTGTKIKDHYFNATKNLKSTVPALEDQSIQLTELKKKNVVQYSNPIIDQGEIYFTYADRRDLRAIFKYNKSGKHEKIVYQGLALDTYFSKHENLFVWEELQRDIRRGNQNFTNLVLYDAIKKEKRLLGRGEAYRSPSFSNDGKNLIFVNGYKGTQSGISMLNIENNNTIHIIKSDTKQFLYPIQSEDGKSVYSIVKEGHLFALAEIDLKGEISMLTEFRDVVFGPIKLSENHLIFQANYGVTDQIHALDLKTRTVKKISNDAIGMYNPSGFYGDKIVAERPHSQGFLLHEIQTKVEDWEEIELERRADLPVYLQTDHLEPNNILDKVPDEKFEMSKYPRNTKVFRPHSWLLSTDGTEFSAQLFSTNILNNVTIDPRYRYNANVDASFVDVSINYGRWFPIYQLSYVYSLPRVVEFNDGEIVADVSQHSIRPGFILPFNFSRGTYLTALRMQNSFTQGFLQIQNQETLERFDQQSSTLTNALAFTHRRLIAQQNIFPRWGYLGQISNRHRFNDGHNGINIANDIYIPGFHRNHGFKLEFDYAQQNVPAEDRVYHVDLFNYAHGFTAVNFDRIWSFNTNYGLPLLYPDWGFADFMYFKRIKSTVFHNYNSIMFEEQKSEFQSLGADLLFDVVFNNTVFSEITVGFRNAYMIGPLPSGKSIPYHFEFIAEIPAF